MNTNSTFNIDAIAANIAATVSNDLESDPYIETPWKIIHAYFKGQHLERLVRHQLESYNNFVSCQIQKTIAMFNPEPLPVGAVAFIAPSPAAML